MPHPSFSRPILAVAGLIALLLATAASASGPGAPNLTYDEIDYQALKYYSAPKQKVERESLDEELRAIIDAKTSEWGITVQSVEIRDVKLPADRRQ